MSFPSPRDRKFQIGGPDNNIFLGCKHAVNGGLEHIHQNIESPSNGMVVTTTSSYNTGWMHGDCKGAFLSDTDTTNSVEYITNGYFNSNVNDWTIGSTGTTATLSSNRMLITAPSSGPSWGYVYQAITTEVGKTYKISLYYRHINFK